jgi:hypothetical protein
MCAGVRLRGITGATLLPADFPVSYRGAINKLAVFHGEAGHKPTEERALADAFLRCGPAEKFIRASRQRDANVTRRFTLFSLTCHDVPLRGSPRPYAATIFAI